MEDGRWIKRENIDGRKWKVEFEGGKWVVDLIGFMLMIKSFRDLQIYTESYDLMIIVHKGVKQFPIYEKHDLAQQMRRASKSIPANIAEGWAKRNHEKDFKRHLDICLGSCNEMEVHVETAKDLGYWLKDFCYILLNRYTNLGGKIANLRKNWQTF